MKQLVLLLTFLIPYIAIAQPSWQQRVDTKIDVRLDDKNHMLHAFEEITYTNNSPDTLRFIYMHLWPNAYKNDNTAFARQFDEQGNTAFYYAKERDRGHIDSLTFVIGNDQAEHFSTEDAPDIARIDLPTPLLPGKTIKIATPFRVKIPKVFSRLGHTEQAYCISQWFPKPAVYDQQGWHPISYLDQGEFYSEFGSYDVAITLPSNYVLMATGNCMDESENKWLDELAAKALPAKSKIVAKKTATPASDIVMKTVHFHEDNVHDFAWFADKRWIVRKDTVHSPGTNQLVTVWAAFLPGYTGIWDKATDYLKETVKHYGKWVGPYQYKTMKAVLGDMHAGGGMEYPTITVIDRSGGIKLSEVVIHEGGHNWFYGMLGSNERDHPWMDEGINTFYEEKTSRALDSAAGKKRKLDENTLIYYQQAATHNSQPIAEPAAAFTRLNMLSDIYTKTSLAMAWLEQYMGLANFEAGMKEYYDTWHFHHPQPADLERCMQKHTDKDLKWFFKDLLTSTGKIDYTITHARRNGANTDVTVRNNSHVNGPVLISAYKDDSIIASTWSAPFTRTATLSLPTTDWDRLKVNEVIPDAKSSNDVYHGGPFHHFGLSVRPFLGTNTGEKDKIWVAPAIGYNYYDGFMAGLLIHNLTVPENRFRFALAPMYAFGSKEPVGAASVGYVWYPHTTFQDIMLQVDGKHFHDNETFINSPKQLYSGYTKIAPSLSFQLKERDARSPVTRMLTVKGYVITEDTVMYRPMSTQLRTRQQTYELIRYAHNNDRTYNPFSYSLEAHGGADFAKISAEGRIRIDYNTQKKALYVRAYVGKFFPINNDPRIYSRYALNSSFSGINDYLYDGTYMGRGQNRLLGAQQLSVQEGGFKVPVFNNAGRSDNWLAAVNLKTDLPKIPMIRLFFDAAFMPNANQTAQRANATAIQYDGGIEVSIYKDFCNVYIPIIMSSDFQNYLTNTYGRKNVFTRSISFTLQFQNVNWLRSASSIVRSVAK